MGNKTIDKSMIIEVYNNGQVVHEGTLEKFFEDNQYDEYIVDRCQLLSEQNEVEFEEFSGHWHIVRKDGDNPKWN